MSIGIHESDYLSTEDPDTLLVNASAAHSLLLELWCEMHYGVISLLEQLQKVHPNFEEECVFRALENLRKLRDEADLIQTRIAPHVSQGETT